MSDFEEPVGAPVVDTETGAEEEAFRNSENPDRKYRGATLSNFSFVRKTAAAALGLKYWKLTTDDIIRIQNPDHALMLKLRQDVEPLEAAYKEATEKGEIMDADKFTTLESYREQLATLGEQPEDIDVYDAMAMDAAIVLWLCLQPESMAYRVRRNPREFEKVVDTWAEKNNIFQEGSIYPNWEAIFLFMSIVNDVNKASFKPEFDDKTIGTAEKN